jgi:uncharacterized protein (TIGR02217 family)
MADAFHEVQFPTDISFGSNGGPEFKTEVVALANGHEKRNQVWEYPRERWNVAYGVNTKGLLQMLVTFFMARKGRLTGFRFKNHDDFEATDQELGTGDGSTTGFQLVKLYTSGGETTTRKITKPVTGTVVVYIDSVLQGSGWTVDTTTGIVTFDTPPSSGEVIMADFDFDVPVRFDTDIIPVQFTSYEMRSVDVPVVELKL